MPSDRRANVLMVQGTSSHAGKSVIATALCRIFAQDGYQVAPFKAQNMSLNSFATPDGGEIGRSQAVQAAAALVAPLVEMNPVLLKPEGDRRSQVVLMGRPRAVASAREYHELKPRIWTQITTALDRLRAEFDIVVIEGAGSPAEVNLKQHDIVNMRVGPCTPTRPYCWSGISTAGGSLPNSLERWFCLSRKSGCWSAGT